MSRRHPRRQYPEPVAVPDIPTPPPPTRIGNRGE